MPRFSVIVSTRHSNADLAECLKCLAPRMQTLSRELYEVIVVDDGRKTTSYITVHDHFRWTIWTPGPRHGPGANRNHGAQVSGGDWLVFIDDTCRPEKTWLEAFSKALTAGTATVYEGRITCLGGQPSPRYDARTNLQGGPLPANNLLILRQVFDEIGGYDEAFPHGHLDDVDFRKRLQTAGVKFQFVPDAGVDRPPRRLPWGRGRAAAYECDVVFRQKWGLAHPSLPAALWEQGKRRLTEIRRAPIGVGSVSALLSIPFELATIAARYGQWKRKHAGIQNIVAPW